MSKIQLGKMWVPVQKSGAYPGAYIRSRGVARSSEKVKKINEALKEAAKSCKGKHTKDRSFQNCVADKMKGKKA